MSVSTGSLPAALEKAAGVPGDFVWRLSVEQYHDMIRAAILTEDAPVELLEGWLVYKMPKNPAHSTATGLVKESLERSLPAGWFVDSLEPVTLTDSEPEPDVTVVRGSRRQYADHHPGAQDLGLVIEVAESTIERDRGMKKRLYARAGVPAYWIIDLNEYRLESYTEPTGPADLPDYKVHEIYRRGDSVPFMLDGCQVAQIAVAELLP